MVGKRKTRMAYFEGAKQALEEHFRATETGPQALKGVSGEKLDKLLASVRKDHDKLVAKIAQRAAAEDRRA